MEGSLSPFPPKNRFFLSLLSNLSHSLLRIAQVSKIRFRIICLSRLCSFVNSEQDLVPFLSKGLSSSGKGLRLPFLFPPLDSACCSFLHRCLSHSPLVNVNVNVNALARQSQLIQHSFSPHCRNHHTPSLPSTSTQETHAFQDESSYSLSRYFCLLRNWCVSPPLPSCFAFLLNTPSLFL